MAIKIDIDKINHEYIDYTVLHDEPLNELVEKIGEVAVKGSLYKAIRPAVDPLDLTFRDYDVLYADPLNKVTGKVNEIIDNLYYGGDGYKAYVKFIFEDGYFKGGVANVDYKVKDGEVFAVITAGIDDDGSIKPITGGYYIKSCVDEHGYPITFDPSGTCEVKMSETDIYVFMTIAIKKYTVHFLYEPSEDAEYIEYTAGKLTDIDYGSLLVKSKFPDETKISKTAGTKYKYPSINHWYYLNGETKVTWNYDTSVLTDEVSTSTDFNLYAEFNKEAQKYSIDYTAYYPLIDAAGTPTGTRGAVKQTYSAQISYGATLSTLTPTVTPTLIGNMTSAQFENIVWNKFKVNDTEISGLPETMPDGNLHLFGDAALKEYLVQFFNKGEETPMQQNIKYYGTRILAIKPVPDPTYTQEGHTWAFAEWTYKNNGSTVYDSSIVDKNVDLLAKYSDSINTHKLTIRVKDGETIVGYYYANLSYGKVINYIEDITQFKDASNKALLKPQYADATYDSYPYITMPDEDITIDAKTHVLQYTVKVNTKDCVATIEGIPVPSIGNQYNYGTTITIIATANTGYKFTNKPDGSWEYVDATHVAITKTLNINPSERNYVYEETVSAAIQSYTLTINAKDEEDTTTIIGVCQKTIVYNFGVKLDDYKAITNYFKDDTIVDSNKYKDIIRFSHSDFKMPAEDKTIEAFTERREYLLAVNGKYINVTLNGAPINSITEKYGETIQIKVTTIDDSTYEFASIPDGWTKVGNELRKSIILTTHTEFTVNASPIGSGIYYILKDNGVQKYTYDIEYSAGMLIPDLPVWSAFSNFDTLMYKTLLTWTNGYFDADGNPYTGVTVPGFRIYKYGNLQKIDYTLTINWTNASCKIDNIIYYDGKCSITNCHYNDEYIVLITANEGYSIKGAATYTEKIVIKGNIEKTYTPTPKTYAVTFRYVLEGAAVSTSAPDTTDATNFITFGVSLSGYTPSAVPTYNSVQYSFASSTWAYYDNGTYISGTMPASEHVVAVKFVKLQLYKVKYQNSNYQDLEIHDNVPYGTVIPAYTGETPTQQKTAEFSYQFDGWSYQSGYSATSAVKGNVTIIAKFKSIVNKYTITLYDFDDNPIINGSKLFDYGSTKSQIDNWIEKDKLYPKELPTIEGYTVTAGSWHKRGTTNVIIQTVTEDAEYRAYYNKTPIVPPDYIYYGAVLASKFDAATTIDEKIACMPSNIEQEKIKGKEQHCEFRIILDDDDRGFLPPPAPERYVAIRQHYLVAISKIQLTFSQLSQIPADYTPSGNYYIYKIINSRNPEAEKYYFNFTSAKTITAEEVNLDMTIKG